MKLRFLGCPLCYSYEQKNLNSTDFNYFLPKILKGENIDKLHAILYVPESRKINRLLPTNKIPGKDSLHVKNTKLISYIKNRSVDIGDVNKQCHPKPVSLLDPELCTLAEKNCKPKAYGP